MGGDEAEAEEEIVSEVVGLVLDMAGKGRAILYGNSARESFIDM